MKYDRAIGYLLMHAEVARNNKNRAVAYGPEFEVKKQTDIEAEYREAIAVLQSAAGMKPCVECQGGKGAV
jgi:hypothetical protein